MGTHLGVFLRRNAAAVQKQNKVPAQVGAAVVAEDLVEGGNLISIHPSSVISDIDPNHQKAKHRVGCV